MKNSIRVFVVMICVGIHSLSMFAQQKITNRMFEDLRVLDEVTYLSFSKNMLDLIDFDVDSDMEGQEYNITGDLNEVKLVLYKPTILPDISFKDQVGKYMKKGNFSLVEEEDGDDDSEVWIDRKGKKVYECHIIFQGDKNGVLLSFFGDFKLEDVDKLKKKIEDYKD